MNTHFQFEHPWVLALLALLPVYAFLRGRAGKYSALIFPSADLARAAGGTARAAVGRLLFFLRLLTVALCIVALAGPRFANDRTETQASGVDIMLVLDLSWSMMALDMGSQDESGSRFAIASEVLEDFIRKRLAPAEIPNDGKQTPFRGHPVFVAQHATACCCRGCLAKWHQIEAGRPLSEQEFRHVLAVLERWLRSQGGAAGPKQQDLWF